ncbi:MAG: SDR family oxidoreductase, partial [Solirubrobacteraceae bacterium]
LVTVSKMVAVTGSTGALGSRVAYQLAAAGASQILVSRRPERQPRVAGALHRGPAEYADTAAMQAALHGADTLFLVSGHLSGRRLAEHSSAIDAAVQAGVRQIVYVSLMGAAPDATFLHARDHAQTEQYLATVPIAWTVLRPCFYSSMLAGLADAEGLIRGPAADGTLSAVAHDDIARVAATVLLDETDAHNSQTYLVTGPESIDLTEAARQLSVGTGRAYRYRAETVVEAYAWRRDLDATATQIDGWISWYQAIAHGEVAEVSDVVERLTGRRPLSVAENTRLGLEPRKRRQPA